MRSSSAALLTALAAVVLGGCAVKDTGREVTLENHEARTDAALIAAGDADSLQAAALLGVAADEPEPRLQLLQRAAAAAPDRPDIAWWHLQLCSRVESCDPRPIEAHLRALDPGNGAAWSAALERSGKLKDAAALHAAVEAMSNAERFGVYWNQTIARVANAVIRTRAMEPKGAFIEALEAANAQATPYQQIAEFCQGRLLPDKLATCRRLSALLRRGDTYLSEMIGLAMAERVWPKGSAEYQAAAQERRVAEYRNDADERLLSQKKEPDNAWAVHRLELLAAHDTEQEVVLAAITSAGLNPDPPPDYKFSRSHR
jgi:hypothetical protein